MCGRKDVSAAVIVHRHSLLLSFCCDGCDGFSGSSSCNESGVPMKERFVVVVVVVVVFVGCWLLVVGCPVLRDKHEPILSSRVFSPYLPGEGQVDRQRQRSDDGKKPSR